MYAGAATGAPTGGAGVGAGAGAGNGCGEPDLSLLAGSPSSPPIAIRFSIVTSMFMLFACRMPPRTSLSNEGNICLSSPTACAIVMRAMVNRFDSSVWLVHNQRKYFKVYFPREIQQAVLQLEHHTASIVDKRKLASCLRAPYDADEIDQFLRAMDATAFIKLTLSPPRVNFGRMKSLSRRSCFLDSLCLGSGIGLLRCASIRRIQQCPQPPTASRRARQVRQGRGYLLHSGRQSRAGRCFCQISATCSLKSQDISRRSREFQKVTKITKIVR
jgi:hypothetical protein